VAIFAHAQPGDIQREFQIGEPLSAITLSGMILDKAPKITNGR
jgi:hypothetical protein